MGFYIQTDAPKNKAMFLIEKYGCTFLTKTEATEAVKNKKGVVVVVDNGPFEAADFTCDLNEFERFIDPRDTRPKIILGIDYDIGCKLSGYSQ